MLPAAWNEWWREVFTAIGRAPWRTGGADGTQGTAEPTTGAGHPSDDGGGRGGEGGDSDADDTPSADSALWQTPVADLSYNQLVRDAMADQGRTDRMDTLERHLTDDHLRVFITKILYCTGCILVLVVGLAGLLAVMAACRLTNPWLMGTATGVVMTPVVALSRQLTKLIAQAGTTEPTLSDDRRAVIPAQRPELPADRQSADGPS
ncbi:hypothetical protein [Streptomyces sp. NBC_00038]|uniref:hypothetical protein n=1 Tax=Streptomyces sp. NBC_00038 TaxID=2903615 RepID=UPI0022545D70|nr:hypothetical protein [Streptomyces sp. NBC_00038]MCX5556661.1 hypothetical protein [Streptomyces sp. NBC_00038]